jgi:modulator of FtsH protease HflK
MPWNNQGGGWQGGGGQGPWGGRPGGQQPPDLEELLRRSQEKVKKLFPGGGGGGPGGNRKALIAVPLILIAVWLASGFYRVQPDEQGVVLRFGALNRVATPGLNYHIPWPVESVLTPRVTTENLVFVGFRSGEATPSRTLSARDVLEESLMLTGDENIIDIDFVVRWRIRDAAQFLFNTRNPENTIKSAAESVMREVIGRTPIQPALTEARAQIETQVAQGLQSVMDQYGAGVAIAQVQLQKVDPPTAVIEAFRDVQRAAADKERQRNEAEAYRNDIIPRARGEAERMVQEAQGFRDSQEARARGEAGRFLSVLGAYQQAQDITMRRLYLETMEEILRRNSKVLVDDRLQGLVPFLNLTEPSGSRPAGQRPAAPPAAAAAGPMLQQPVRPSPGIGGGLPR